VTRRFQIHPLLWAIALASTVYWLCQPDDLFSCPQGAEAHSTSSSLGVRGSRPVDGNGSGRVATATAEAVSW
jgi:hypothetical protein